MSGTVAGSLEQALTSGEPVEVVLALVDDEIERSFEGGDPATLEQLATRLDVVATERGGEWSPLAIAASRARALSPMAARRAAPVAPDDEADETSRAPAVPDDEGAEAAPVSATPAPPLAGPPSDLAPVGAATPAPEPERAVAYAGWWIRLAAFWIDLFLLGLVFGFIDGAAGESNLAAVLYVAVPVAYFVGMHAYANGATVGKLALRIRVRMVDGSPVGLGRATARAGVTTGLWLSGIGALIDLIVLGVDGRKQSIHDKAAGTIVERVPRA